MMYVGVVLLGLHRGPTGMGCFSRKPLFDVLSFPFGWSEHAEIKKDDIPTWTSGPDGQRAWSTKGVWRVSLLPVYSRKIPMIPLLSSLHQYSEPRQPFYGPETAHSFGKLKKENESEQGPFVSQRRDSEEAAARPGFSRHVSSLRCPRRSLRRVPLSMKIGNETRKYILTWGGHLSYRKHVRWTTHTRLNRFSDSFPRVHV